MVRAAKPRLGSRGRPEETRAAILRAAVREFADKGMAGARTDSIARAAGVNKALLYYYFKDKERLYGAALDHVFSQLSGRLLEVLESALPPGEKIRAYVGAHFDFIAGHLTYRGLVQGEIVRAGHGSPHLQRVAKRYFHPLFSRLGEVIGEGIAAGEFRPVNPLHFVPSMVAVVVFYFTSAPVMQAVTGCDPLSPENLAEHRAAILDFISTALFRATARQSQGEPE